MSGTTLSVLELTKYDFSDLASSGFVTIPAAQNIDVSAYTTGALLVRVHENGLGASASVEVKVQQVLPSPQDPGKFFQGSIIGTVAVTDADLPGRLLTQEITIPLGSYLTLLVAGLQTFNPTTLSLAISVDLSLKP